MSKILANSSVVQSQNPQNPMYLKLSVVSVYLCMVCMYTDTCNVTTIIYVVPFIDIEMIGKLLQQ